MLLVNFASTKKVKRFLQISKKCECLQFESVKLSHGTVNGKRSWTQVPVTLNKLLNSTVVQFPCV